MVGSDECSPCVFEPFVIFNFYPYLFYILSFVLSSFDGTAGPCFHQMLQWLHRIAACVHKLIHVRELLNYILIC